MDLINREQALGCFWNYANDDGTGYDETDMPAYDRLQALPIVAGVEDCISRQDAIDALGDEPEVWTGKDEYAQGLNNQWHYDRNAILSCPSAQPDVKEIGYAECADAMLKMWMDNVLTDGEYNRIMDKLNEHWGKVNA